MSSVKVDPAFGGWRSPEPVNDTPLLSTSALLDEGGDIKEIQPASNGNLDHAHAQSKLHPSLQHTHSPHPPSFQQPCPESEEDDRHAHAFDLLGLSMDNSKRNQPQPITQPQGRVEESTLVPSSVPARTDAHLWAARPPAAVLPQVAPGAGARSRRMSSSTSQIRGKSGFLGSTPSKDSRPSMGNHATSYTSTAPNLQRKSSNAPPLYDFSRTDRNPSGSRMGNGDHAAHGIAASMPVGGHLDAHMAHAHGHTPSPEDLEFSMQFGSGSDEDDRPGSPRSDSGDLEMELDVDDDGEIHGANIMALGSGSGGVKGRRKGITFPCEVCGKVYRHPSCLTKHRWEHSPHWREPAATNMSKHQQVQMLEAAAILAVGSSLPKDKSLWSIAVHQPGSTGSGRRGSTSTSLSAARSPSSSNMAPLTPSSLREPTSLGALSERPIKERKSSPGSDSTTSSMGAGEPYPGSKQPPQPVNGGGLGLRNQYPPAAVRASRTPSFSNAPAHPSSLPDMTGLHFHPGTSSGHGASPIPNRGYPLSLQSRAGMIGGGMFGVMHTRPRSSSIRGGGGEDLLENDEDQQQEREGEDWSMATNMEL